MQLDLCKKIAAQKALTEVGNHTVVGLGTGSTVFYFIQGLIEKVHQGLDIRVIASSEHSAKLAKDGGLAFADIQLLSSIDLTVDGADEIDVQKRMIKGGGGALVREKILAQASKKVVIIVDETKVVIQLGAHKLPIEILPFAHHLTIAHLNRFGFNGQLRKKQDGSFFLSDNGNYIFDIVYPNKINSPEKDHLLLKTIPGVVETGLFFNLAHKVYIGYQDGHVETR